MRPNPGSNGGGSGVESVSAFRFINAMAAVQESKASQRRLDRIARAQNANILSLVFDSVFLTISITITVTGPEFGQIHALISARIRANLCVDIGPNSGNIISFFGQQQTTPEFGHQQKTRFR